MSNSERDIIKVRVHDGIVGILYIASIILASHDEQLNQVLKIKEGDTYNGVELEKRIASIFFF